MLAVCAARRFYCALRGMAYKHTENAFRGRVSERDALLEMRAPHECVNSLLAIRVIVSLVARRRQHCCGCPIFQATHCRRPVRYLDSFHQTHQMRVASCTCVLSY